MDGHDLRVRHAIGVAAGESEEARQHAQAALHSALTPPGDVASVAAFLGATPCRLAAIALADILGVIDQVNIPATVTEHPNWRHKLPTAIEDLGHHDGLQRVADAFAQAGRSFKT
jgi:4-alpha-glucanotransferase